MKKSIIYILLITFACSYGTFRYLKQSSDDILMADTKYYELFIGHKIQEENPNLLNGVVNYLVEGYANKGLQKIKPKVMFVTVAAFFVSLIVAIILKVRNRKRYVR